MTKTIISNRIIKMYHQATIEETNRDWYTYENEQINILAERYKLPANKIAGIHSALSPRKEWQLNKRIAIDLITTNTCGHMKVFVKKAKDILHTGTSDVDILGILKGRKISSFYMNILYPDSSNKVTIDRHAIAVALGRTATDKELSLTDKQYTFFEDCYKRASDKLGIRPSLLQSITWEAWKRLK